MRHKLYKRRDLLRAVLDAGFRYVRTKGGHHVYQHGPVMVVLPTEGPELSDGVVHQITKKLRLVGASV